MISLENLYSDQRFEQYYTILSDWNKKINLTSLCQKEDIFFKHFLDSVLFYDFFKERSSLLDVGSGAGFPGVCLKLVRDDLDVTLVDSVGKKVLFLQELISQLNLSNIVAVKSRIEEFNKKDFDYVTARAVASTNILAEYCLPFVKIGGFAAFYKSDDIDTELESSKAAIEFLGGRVEKVIRRKLSPDITRSLVVLKKVTPTPKGYPRRGNKPRKNPL